MEISDRGKAELEIMGQISERRERGWGKRESKGGRRNNRRKVRSKERTTENNEKICLLIV